ncbi:MAG TPA: hypothetical protein VHG28_12310 [Longimicrobiaceae bacterium]|nr:hypothetical protein [Longimicrobiaceae bacterium]
MDAFPDEAQLFGQLRTELDPSELAAALTAEGVKVELRESSHYAGGTYLRIRIGGGDDCALERVGPEEYLVHDSAGALAALSEGAERLSGALARLGIRHRLEVYAPGDRLAGYLHHHWPPPDP